MNGGGGGNEDSQNSSEQGKEDMNRFRNSQQLKGSNMEKQMDKMSRLLTNEQ